MVTENNYLIPEWPDALQHVDVVRVRFDLGFISPCHAQPSDFFGIGRALRVAGRQLLDTHDTAAIRQWKDLFQPALSDDLAALRKFQKPAPPFVITMPIMQPKSFDVGDQLEFEVLFLGTGIPLIHDFLRSLIHLGHLGLVAGEGRFEVNGVYSRESAHSEVLVWRRNEPFESLTFVIQPLNWLLQKDHIANRIVVKYRTPTRLMVNGKPLRKPHFSQVFPFMLRRATAMLYAHGGVEVLDSPMSLLELVRDLDEAESDIHWHDWRPLAGQRGLAIGGFTGEMKLAGQALEEIYWVFGIASLLGIGKGATYGSGQISLCS